MNTQGRIQSFLGDSVALLERIIGFFFAAIMASWGEENLESWVCWYYLVIEFLFDSMVGSKLTVSKYHINVMSRSIFPWFANLLKKLISLFWERGEK